MLWAWGQNGRVCISTATSLVAQVGSLFGARHKKEVEYPCNISVHISDRFFPPRLINGPHHGVAEYAFILEHGAVTNNIFESELRGDYLTAGAECLAFWVSHCWLVHIYILIISLAQDCHYDCLFMQPAGPAEIYVYWINFWQSCCCNGGKEKSDTTSRLLL
jgi:hypothetical protein